MENSLKEPTRWRNHSRATKIGAADVEAERVVLERCAVPIAHEETDQPRVGLVHLVLAPGEADARRVHDREIGRHRVVEPDEAVVEDTDRVLGYHSG